MGWEAVYGVWDKVNKELRLYVGPGDAPAAAVLRLPHADDDEFGLFMVAGGIDEQLGFVTWAGRFLEI